jgi:poly-beta-1,6-N-acetyl-D-glucosamine N-deacetylase
VCAIGVALALAAPAFVAIAVLHVSHVAAQLDPPPVTLTPAELAQFHAFRSVPQRSPVVISFHDVLPAARIKPGNRYPVTPEQFSLDMQMLDEAGFHSITAQQFLDYLRGKPVPPRSVFITFDDGTKGNWVYADRVLAQHHFHAAEFVIGGVVDEHQPYYVSWPELHRMYASGRWDIEAHTFLGHWRVPVDDKGNRQPFLVNREWLPALDRQETITEWYRRVETDLLRSKTVLQQHGYPEPHLFAYPFSAIDLPTNDPRIPHMLERLATSLFDMTFVNAQNAGLLTRRAAADRLLNRVEVFNTTSVDRLFDRIAMWTPEQVAALHPLEMPERWDQFGQPIPASAFHDDSVTLPLDQTLRGNGFFARGRLSDWSNYGTTVTMSNLGFVNGGPTATLRVWTGSDDEHDINVSATWLRINRGSGGAEARVVDHALTKGDTHVVSVTLANGQIVVVVDGVDQYRATVPDIALGLPSGGVALATELDKPGSLDPVFSGLRIAPLPGVPVLDAQPALSTLRVPTAAGAGLDRAAAVATGATPGPVDPTDGSPGK